jgi:hypothetical protein
MAAVVPVSSTNKFELKTIKAVFKEFVFSGIGSFTNVALEQEFFS